MHAVRPVRAFPFLRRAWPALTAAGVLHGVAFVGVPVTLSTLQGAQSRPAASMVVRTLAAARVAPDERAPSAPTDAADRTTAAAPKSQPLRVAAPVNSQPAMRPRAVPTAAPRSAAAARSPAPEYRTAGLDPGPRPLDAIEPVYPLEAGQQAGSVVLRLLIGKDGKVDEAGVVRSDPPGLFDRAAISAFAAARFSPGLFLGVPVKSQITIEVAFTLIDRGSAVSPQTY